MSELYIYGVMRGEEASKINPSTLFPGRPIQLIVKNGLGAVAQATTVQKFEATQEALIDHFTVLLNLMSVGTVLPIRFGTVAGSKEEVGSLLKTLSGLSGERSRTIMDEVFERLKGKVEFDVEARWNPQVAYSRIAQGDPEIKAFKERLATQGALASMEDRIAVGKLVAGAVAKYAEVCRQKIKETLCEVSLESCPLPMKRDQELFMNKAFFVEEGRVEAFEKKLVSLGESFQEAVHFKYAGPLPPYSFTGCEIKAITSAVLDEARQVLGLGETFTQEEFTDRYHKLLLKWHPDCQTLDTEEALEKSKSLSSAGKILELFFRQYGEKFDKENIPETILLVEKELGCKEHLEWV